jgi:hypothetical protein
LFYRFEASVFIDDDMIAQDTAKTKKEARNKAVSEALSLLKQNQVGYYASSSPNGDILFYPKFFFHFCFF